MKRHIESVGSRCSKEVVEGIQTIVLVAAKEEFVPLIDTAESFTLGHVFAIARQLNDGTHRNTKRLLGRSKPSWV